MVQFLKTEIVVLSLALQLITEEPMAVQEEVIIAIIHVLEELVAFHLTLLSLLVANHSLMEAKADYLIQVERRVALAAVVQIGVAVADIQVAVLEDVDPVFGLEAAAVLTIRAQIKTTRLEPTRATEKSSSLFLVLRTNLP